MIVTITGTPGAGKTYIAERISKRNECKYLDLNKFIKKNRLYDDYDRKDKTFEVDVRKVRALTFKEFKGGKALNTQSWKTMKIPKNSIIIDSHLSHYIKADLCIVVRASIETLFKRLTKRNYSRKKIMDNLESEIFGVCFEEAKSMNKRVLVVYNEG